VIWGIEAIMIFGVGAIAAQGFTDAPYCEATGQWTTVRTLPMQFAVPDDVQQAASPASLLQVLQPAAEPTNTYTEVSIATAEGSELRCVSLDSIVVEVDKEGKEDKKKKPLVRNMLFDRDSFEKLLQLAGPTTA
jgi:hypothetical protein